MIRRLLLHVAAAIAGLWIAIQYFDETTWTGTLIGLGIAGGILGLANAILKPVLNLLTLPIRILTLGLSSFVISAALVWLIDIFFPELDIVGLLGLLKTTLAVWGAGVLLSLLSKGRL